jgi:TPR repeat protein
MMRKFLVFMIIFALPALAAAEKSFPELLGGAERGFSADMLGAGLAYYHGDGVERDCYEARRWLKRAAEAGEVEALYRLGTIDDEGTCGIAQAESAAEFYRQAAEKGHAGARYRLGELYLTGRGVDPDPAAAFKWLELAAGQGEPRAFCALARMYLKGSGVPVNRQKGLRWLRRGLASQNTDAVELCRELQAEAGL